MLGCSVSLLGGHPKPPDRFGIVLHHVDPIGVHHSKGVLVSSVSFRGATTHGRQPCRVEDRREAARVHPKNLLLCQTVSWNEEERSNRCAYQNAKPTVSDHHHTSF